MLSNNALSDSIIDFLRQCMPCRAGHALTQGLPIAQFKVKRKLLCRFIMRMNQGIRLLTSCLC